ncbi:MAG: amidohydrolase family protein [Gammaproteobacteria bacterium]
MKIDIFNHIWPQAYFETVKRVVPRFLDMGKRVTSVPMLMDLDIRFRVMDAFENYYQVLSLSSPPVEVLAPTAEDAATLARVANDTVADACARHPDRFPGFIATLALTDAETMVTEAERAIESLGAVGVLIYTNAAGRPIDGPEFEPLYARMARYGLPIWIHPTRTAAMSDYPSEPRSRFEIWWTLGWPYETTAAMARLAFSGVLDRYPSLQFITHHGGGLAPMLEGRLGPGWDQMGTRTSDEDYFALLKKLKHRPLDYFRMFYADSALFTAAGATRLALEFFGEDRFLFASDAPFDPEQGPMYIRETIRILDELEITETARRKIYSGNAMAMLKLENTGGKLRRKALADFAAAAS